MRKALAIGAVAMIGLLSPIIASAGDAGFVPPPPGHPVFGYPLAGYPIGDIGYNGYGGEPVLYGAYHGDGSCYFVKHRVRTPYGWHSYLTQICG